VVTYKTMQHIRGWSVRRSHLIEGEAFQAHKHLSQKSKQSFFLKEWKGVKGQSQRSKQSHLWVSLQPHAIHWQQ